MTIALTVLAAVIGFCVIDLRCSGGLGPESACTLENFIAVAIAEDASREIPPWDKSSKYEIICRDANKVSYRATEYQYTGGAHGSTLIQVGTIDRKTGRKYTLADPAGISFSLFFQHTGKPE